MKYRKKPVVEAIQWTGDNLDEIIKFIGTSRRISTTTICGSPLESYIEILNHDSKPKVHLWDYIMKDMKGEVTVWSPQLFEEYYRANENEDGE